MKISEAMLIKREIGANCHVDVKMLDTSDGIVLSIEENLINPSSAAFIASFVNQHKLKLLLDNECYFISTTTLSPTGQYAWE